MAVNPTPSGVEPTCPITKRIDWTRPLDVDGPTGDPWAWSTDELADLTKRVTLVLAADGTAKHHGMHQWSHDASPRSRPWPVVSFASTVIYDDALTTAFLETAERLLASLASSAELLLALERRYGRLRLPPLRRRPAHPRPLPFFLGSSLRWTTRWTTWTRWRRRTDTFCTSSRRVASLTRLCRSQSARRSTAPRCTPSQSLWRPSRSISCTTAAPSWYAPPAHTAVKPRSLADLGPPYCALFSTLLRAVLRPIALCSLPYCTLFSALLRSSLPGTLASAVDTGHPPLTFSLGPLEKKEEKEKACTLCCEGATGRQWGEIGTRRGRCARCAPPAPPACPTVSTWRRRGSQCR